MGSFFLYLYFFAQKFRLFPNDYVQNSFGSSKIFSNFGFKSAVIFYVCCIETDHINLKFTSKINGAFVVKFLRDNGEFVLAKNFFGSYYRIQGAKTGIIKEDFIGWYPATHQGIFKIGWFIVSFGAIVSAD